MMFLGIRKDLGFLHINTVWKLLLSKHSRIEINLWGYYGWDTWEEEWVNNLMKHISYKK